MTKMNGLDGANAIASVEAAQAVRHHVADAKGEVWFIVETEITGKVEEAA